MLLLVRSHALVFTAIITCKLSTIVKGQAMLLIMIIMTKVSYTCVAFRAGHSCGICKIKLEEVGQFDWHE